MNGKPATQSALKLLESLGCLPPVDSSPFQVLAGDFLPGLVELWTRWRQTAPRNRHDRAVRIECWLRACVEQGAVLTQGTSVSPDLDSRWLEQRLFFWPRGIPSGTRIGLAASRLGQNLDAQRPLFRTMRQIVSEVATVGDVLVAAEASSLGRITERCCRLFDQRMIRIVVSTHKDPSDWLSRLEERIRPGQLPGHEWPVFISPLMSPSGDGSSDSGAEPTAPLQDVALSLLSDQLFVLTLRSGGNLEAILQKRLSNADVPVGSVRLAVGDGLCTGESVRQLQSLGAVSWSCSNDSFDPSPSVVASTHAVNAADAESRVSIRALPSDEDQWLTHWTRRMDCPAPGESEEQFLDALILELPESNRSALASLTRILADRRLRASGLGLRGGGPAVSFSAIPLRELVRKRVFRAHRKRWDFEHFGICIREKRLQQIGARPVIYGDDVTWSQLPEGERLWFQQRFSNSPAGTIDWSIEREWRFPGDVDLAQFAPEDVFLFCPGNSEAAVLQKVTDWPIVTVETLLAG